jgi:hypothetical protein
MTRMTDHYELIEQIERMVQARVRRAQNHIGLGSERSRLKQRTRENQASEILGLIRKIKMDAGMLNKQTTGEKL